MVGDSEPSRRPGPERGGRVRPGQYAPAARDARFRLLRARFLRAAAGIVLVSFGWYFAYVVLSAFARGFMARRVAGSVNVALLLGLTQFAATFVLAWAYTAYARRRLDPLADELRAELDGPPVTRDGAAPAAVADGAERREAWRGTVRPDFGGLR
ncbi:DUF485 domain-containing protein [Actinomadura fibrosa]|uniref:DUF485 domain-containing protein n=1 Tax=Actinomadura fibrosa TaxID=111802 RepID=A0ABW2Y046_9ACTN|nr:DUF485 domain-containing protein [Actinomadura fibrosa]